MSTRSAFNSGGPAVFVIGPDCAWHLVTDYSGPQCPLCRDSGELRVWHPELRDELSYALAPVSEHTITIPCPACKREAD